MTRIYKLKDNGACKGQRISCCANDQARLTVGYNFGNVCLIVENRDHKNHIQKLLNSLYEETFVEIFTLNSFLRLNRHELKRFENIFIDTISSNRHAVIDVREKLARCKCEVASIVVSCPAANYERIA